MCKTLRLTEVQIQMRYVWHDVLVLALMKRNLTRRISKYLLCGGQAEIISDPNRLEARTDLVDLLSQVVVVTILVAQEIIVWIIAAIVSRILFNKPIAKDFDGMSLLHRIDQNERNGLGKSQLIQGPTAG